MKYNVCLFPGQGSQHTGMGKDLFPLFPEYVDQASAVLGYDIVALCLNNPENQLQQTNFTQPALYVVNALSYLKHLQEKGRPDVVLGHSLGEFNALFAAKAFDFKTGLRLVQKRGELMARCEKGGMAAVIGLELEDIKKIIRVRFPDLDIANINSAQQITISGPVKTIEKASSVFEDEFATYIPLPVGGAFHSRYMKPAQNTFEKAIGSFDFNTLEINIISNVTARPYVEGQLPGLILEQMTSPVKWHESIKYLLEKGSHTFYEVGAGKVLTNLVHKIQREAKQRRDT